MVECVLKIWNASRAKKFKRLCEEDGIKVLSLERIREESYDDIFKYSLIRVDVSPEFIWHLRQVRARCYNKPFDSLPFNYLVKCGVFIENYEEMDEQCPEKTFTITWTRGPAE